MMNVVIDTNVIMSALYFGGSPLKLINLLRKKNFEAYASFDIVAEYNDVYSRLENKTGRKADRLAFDSILACIKVISDFPKVEVSRDKDDDKFLSCALNCHAVYIVTGDKDLLTLHEFEGVKIITVADFLNVAG